MRMMLVVAAAVACSGSGEGSRPDYSRTGVMEVVFTFPAKEVHASDLRPALAAAGDPDAELMETRIEVDGRTVDAIRVRVPLRLDTRAPQRDLAGSAIQQRFADRIQRLAWSGDRLLVRANASLPGPEIQKLIEAAGLEVARMDIQNDDATGNTNATFTLTGPEVSFERAIERQLPGVDAVVVSVESVGPRGVH